MGTLILAGAVLFMIGFLPQAITDEEREPLVLAFGTISAAGVGLLGMGLWFWRRTFPQRRLAALGMWLLMVGLLLFFLQTIVMMVSVAQTGKIPDVFIFIGLAFILFTVGPLLLGLGISAGMGPPILFKVGSWQASLGALMALFGGESPFHDTGLLVLGFGWLIFGLGAFPACAKQEGPVQSDRPA